MASTVMGIGALKVTNLVDASVHPHALKTSYCFTSVSGGTTTMRYFVNPEYSVPKPSAQGEEWSPKHSPFMFWGIRRSHEEDKWNCEIEAVVVNLVLAAGFNETAHFAGEDPVSDAAFVELPVLVNTRAICKGEEVVLRCMAPAPKEKKTKVKTWQSEVPAAKKNKTEKQ